MSNRTLNIKSYKGEYKVHFVTDPFEKLANFTGKVHFIIDKNIVKYYGQKTALKEILERTSHVLVEANEENKSFEKMEGYIDQLLEHGIKRDHQLVAIGGGITQDITCFVASTLFRGIDWIFFPTTLLAQSDSCIGSKSSINYKTVKNLIGTFNPPREIYLSVAFQKTLEKKDIQSGIGEMIKVHVINGLDSFKKLQANYDELSNDEVMLEHLTMSLEFKKKLIEIDEFDKGVRNVMNYGHSFGHAIESATNFGLPHGIAVTIGMDLANFTSWKQGYISEELFKEMHKCMKKNYHGFSNIDIPREQFYAALGKDKKNKDNQYAIILINKDHIVEKQFFDKGSSFNDNCEQYFTKYLRGD